MGMGGAIDNGVPCDGSDVLDELNAVFNDPGSVRYTFARNNNIFGEIKPVAGNYLALLNAYKAAGVADNRGWTAYLRRLGTAVGGPQKIYRIAQVRHKALTEGVATWTVIHECGSQVDTPDGLSVIDSPSPLTTLDEKAMAKDFASRGSHRVPARDFTTSQTL